MIGSVNVPHVGHFADGNENESHYTTVLLTGFTLASKLWYGRLMCGRYVQSKRAIAHARMLAFREAFAATRTETWNLAPTTQSLLVRSTAEGLSPDWLTWGFRNSPAAPMGPINARVETADSKPTFRDAWRSNRCAVPADGWYEWRLENGKKQPYFFRRRDGEPVFFAGLWSGGTFCILTTAADGDLTQIHDRRPLAIETDEAKRWIETIPKSPEDLVSRRVPPSEIAFHPVSTRVSYAKNDGADLIEEMKVAPGASPELDLFF